MFRFKIPAFALINRAEMPCFPVTNIYIFFSATNTGNCPEVGYK